MPNVAIPGPPEGLWNLKFHQVAIYAHKEVVDSALEFWSQSGYKNWHTDRAQLVGAEHGIPLIKNAEMHFNYDILPLELEYVSYTGLARNSRDDRSGIPPFLSHFSTYVENIAAEVARVEQETGLRPYHRFVTNGHTNPNVQGSKRFMEAIYNTRRFLGFDVKMIQRVPWTYPQNWVAEWAEGSYEI